MAADPRSHQHGHVSTTKAVMLAFCVVGIWASYLTQGVLQESLSTKKFGPDLKRFEHLAFLNLAQNVVCFIVALFNAPRQPAPHLGVLGPQCYKHRFLRRSKRNITLQCVLFPASLLGMLSVLIVLRTPFDNQPPIWAYWGPSVTNTVGPACGLIALKYISYPAQVLAKSSKMIPVMLAGAILYGVHYTVPEYVCTLLVAGGVSVFALYKSSSKAASKLASPNAPLGYFLCFLNLGLDGFTNATQDAITKKYPLTGTYHLMMGMNLWGAIYMAVYMFAWPYGGGWDAVAFLRTHNEAAWDILMFCVCGAVGQNFIFLTINTFGALINTTITTTRKFMSILISAVWTGSPLTGPQWTGVSMVFGGLSYQIFLKWQKSSRKKRGAQAVAAGGKGANGASPEHEALLAGAGEKKTK